MGSDGVPGRDSLVPTEIVHESGRTRITRLFLPEGTVIRKEPLGPDGERRVRHETAVLERLRGVAGVARLAGRRDIPGRSCWPTPAGSAWRARRSRLRSMS